MVESRLGHLLRNGSVVSSRYTIICLLGQGGMGSVYVASDNLLGGQYIALKVLHRELIHDEMLVKRFLQEVELMRRVNHANVVRTFDVGEDSGIVYFSMELIVGNSLDQILDRIASDGDISPTRIARLGLQISAGLTAIHAADILHRDLKPQNLIVQEGDTVKITDFGIARPSDSKLTQHLEILGSADYIAPEMWLSQKLTPSVDLYAFGIVLYELVTGRLPFTSEETPRLMWMHLKQQPQPPNLLRSDTPSWLNQLVLALLQKAPGQRPKSAASVYAFLEANIDNKSQLTRMPELLAGKEAGSSLVSSSHSSVQVHQSAVVYRPSPTVDKGQRRSWGWPASIIALVMCGIFIPTRELCACVTLQENINLALGVPASTVLDANTLATHLEQFTPLGLSRNVVEKKLFILAAERPNRCGPVDPLTFRCRFELRKGLIRTRVLEVTVEYPPATPDVVGKVSVSDFTEFLGYVLDQRLSRALR